MNKSKERGEEKMGYPTLRGELAKRKISIEELALLLGLHRNSVSNKLNGSSCFTIEESMKIQETYFPDKELKYLFEKEEKGA